MASSHCIGEHSFRAYFLSVLGVQMKDFPLKIHIEKWFNLIKHSVDRKLMRRLVNGLF